MHRDSRKRPITIAIKMPVFSFEKIRGADISLGPEMKSTGECLGIAKTFNEALYKAFQGAGIKLPKYKNMIITVRDSDKEEMVDIADRFKAQGYRIFCYQRNRPVPVPEGRSDHALCARSSRNLPISWI